MIAFRDWLIQRESSPATRARTAAALGLLPLATVGSIHGHSTASPWQVEKIAKQMRKQKKRKFGATKNKKKVAPINRNMEIDKWVKEADELKDSLRKLKDIFDKKKKEPTPEETLKDDEKGKKEPKDPEKGTKKELKKQDVPPEDQKKSKSPKKDEIKDE